MKRLLASFLLAIVLLTSVFVPFAKAAEETWYNSSFQAWFGKAYDSRNPQEIFGERYTAAQVEWVIYGLVAFILNHSGDAEVNQCLIVEGKDISVCGPTIIKAGENLLSFEKSSQEKYAVANIFTNRPISFISYVKNIGVNLGIVKEAHAQGFGYSAAESVQNLWRVARDITYFLMVFAIIIVAFMIMFRVKISPQLVITIQSALPKIIITLLLITFSYAIAGFLIDLMYLVIGIISFLFTNNKISTFPLTGMFGALTTDNSVLSLIVKYMFTFTLALLTVLTSGTSGLVFNLAAPGVVSLIFLLIVIIVLIVLLFAFFKIAWLMLKTYALIILQIVSSPIQLLPGAFSSGVFSGWLKRMAANLAVYPIICLMFLLSFVFLRGVFSVYVVPIINIKLDEIPGMSGLITRLIPFNIDGGFLGSSTWDPPLTFGSGATGILYLGISFVIITLIPKTADIIKSVIEGKPFTYGTAIGEAFGPVKGPLGWGWGTVSGGVQKGIGAAIGNYIKSRSDSSRGTPESPPGTISRTGIPKRRYQS